MSLRKRLEKMRQHASLESHEELLPLKVLGGLTRDGVHLLSTEMGINPEDVLYVAKTDGWGSSMLKEISDTGIRAIVVGGTSRDPIDALLAKTCSELHLPLLLTQQVGAEVRGKSGTMDRRKFEEAMKRWGREQEEQEKQKKTEMLESIFREYRFEREKEVHRGK